MDFKVIYPGKALCTALKHEDMATGYEGTGETPSVFRNC